MEKKKITSVHDFKTMKEDGVPISMVTCYDYSFARILSETDIDALLIGDSCGNVMAGYDTTIPVSVDEIIYHARAVRRGAPDAFLVADMPFLSYHISKEDAVRNAGRIMKESGVQSVKLEGGIYFCDTIKALVASSIPVMGHLGLTPQSIHAIGGYKVQGKTPEDAERMKLNAAALEEAGCFAIVLEMVPEPLAEEITQSISIPTIGIGAGRYCSGQVLVLQDLLGMDKGYVKKYLKKYAELDGVVSQAIQSYNDDVKKRIFPDENHVFSAKK
jgi:3-methyl-2-oxobutanoate hydroxymethyltransferase